MNYQSLFRQNAGVHYLQEKILKATTKPWKIMEICGGQTHAIAKFGLFDLLPKEIELIHGPGCPVCVTPQETLDHVMHIAAQSNVILCTFGDMLRVPGSQHDLFTLKALGAKIKVIYSPLEAVEIALENPHQEIVLFAVGFETTAPAHAMAIKKAHLNRLKNFSVIEALVLVPPAIEFILQSPLNEVQGFLAAGHVSTIMGNEAYYALCEKYKVPIVITGFEPIDILLGVLHCITQLETNEPKVINAYERSVKEKGNAQAQALMHEIYEVSDTLWRGIGNIAQSGLKLHKNYQAYAANQRFPQPPNRNICASSVCISGEILQGRKKPNTCPAFGKQCTPESPLGAPMVSSEGACSAYYRYLREN